MALAKLTTKGQLTMPKSIREYLKIHAGDQIEFIINAAGEVIVHPKSLSVRDIFGMVTARHKVSIEKMNQAIAYKIRARHKKDERD